MKTIPTPSTAPGNAACFGTRCSRHNACTHYHGVETPDRRRFIGTCRTLDGRYPLFEAVEPRRRTDGEVPVDGEGSSCD